ncbi:hypothetical protein [Veillonella parvula]|uniref:hypothetical protein n=1 Tax=Veillonella parvula TaxID=29466 RepID=UPI003AB90FEF
MPNWCEGWVKFRGTPEEICNFIKGEFNEALPKIDGDILEPNIPPYVAWFKSVHRSYIARCDIPEATSDIEIDSDFVIFTAKVRHAWQVDMNGYSAIAKKYNIDIRGKCYEKGMLFTEGFEFSRNGEQLSYEIKKFKKQELWDWECECPTLGG